MRITEIRVTRGTLKRTYVRKQGRPVHKGDWGDALATAVVLKLFLSFPTLNKGAFSSPTCPSSLP